MVLDGSHTETNGSHDTNNNSHVDPDRPVYINKQWLWEWKSLASVGPINNADIMCSHGQIRIEFKKGIENWIELIPPQIFEYLSRQYGIAPSGPIPINPQSGRPIYCTSCVHETLKERAAREHAIVKKINHKILTESGISNTSFHLSSTPPNPLFFLLFWWRWKRLPQLWRIRTT